MTSYQKAIAEAKADYEALLLAQVEKSWSKVETSTEDDGIENERCGMGILTT